jgi:selenocysteine-specific translation elongation factor
VAYGTLKGGTMKKQDKMFLLPDRKEIEVRSINVDGTGVDELQAASGFEMAYKGDLIERGILAPLRNEYQVENIVNGRFVKNPFFKDELKGKIHAYANMQYVEGHFTDNDLTLSAPLAFEKGELILVIDASNQKLRIAGVFQSKW